MFNRSSFSSVSFSRTSWNGAPVHVIASLGAAPYKQQKTLKRNDEEIEEAISASDISRIRNEFLSESMAQDLINRARKRKARAEEEALLLIL